MDPKYSRIIILVFILLTFQQMSAQEKEIHGFVVSKNNDLSIAHFLLKLRKTSIKYYTDKRGRFKFQVPDTLKKIHFQVNDSFIIEHIERNLKGEYILSIKQNPWYKSLQELMQEKVITASRFNEEISSAPANIEYISSNELVERGYKTVAEAISGIAGLYILYDNVNYNIGIRGVNGGLRADSRIIKLMINNQTLAYNPSSGNYLGLALIPINAIQRIEFIRGPLSSLYGVNAYLGVINIISKEDTKENSLQTGLSVGKTFKGTQTNILMSGSNKSMNYLLSGSYAYNDRSGLVAQDIPNINSRPDSNMTVNDMSKPISLFALFNYKTLKFGKFTLQTSYHELNSMGEFSDWAVLSHHNQINQITYSLNISNTVAYNSSTRRNTSLGFSLSKPGKNNRLAIDKLTTNWIEQDESSKCFTFSTNYSKHLEGKNKILFGTDITADFENLLTNYFHSETNKPYANQDTIFGDTLFFNVGLYFNSKLYPFNNQSFLKNMSLNIGLRYDFHNLFDNNFNYRIGLIYPFTSKFTGKLLLNSSYRAPAPEQLYANYIRTNGIVSNSNLSLQKAQSLEFSITAEVLKNTKVNFTTFYTQIKNNIELILPIGNTSNVKPQNISQIYSTGAELSLNYYSKNQKIYSNISYEKSILKTLNLIKKEMKMKTDLYPPLMIKFGYTLSIPSIYLTINAEGEYIGKRIASESNNLIYNPAETDDRKYSLPDYFIGNVYLSTQNLKFWKNYETRLSLKIRNLGNIKYYYPGFSGFDIPGQGRILNINFTQYF